MPKKFFIHQKSTPPKFSPISKFSAFDVKRCLGCQNCVKNSACIYDINQNHHFDPFVIQDTKDSSCFSCLRCVQECKNNIMSRSINPRWSKLGGAYFTPDIVTSIWKQAETGKIPVSGAGYRGAFSGPGFDQIWTDMSEIVRPTRDGIHGREYISTNIELGRKPSKLTFDDSGNLLTQLPPLVETSIPLIVDIPPFGFIGESTRRAMAKAASNLNTVTVASSEEAEGVLSEFRDTLIVQFDPEKDDIALLKGVQIVELAHNDNVLDVIKAIEAAHPEIIPSVRLMLDEAAVHNALDLAKKGVAIIHLQADPIGRGFSNGNEKFVTQWVRDVHLALVKAAIREQVSLLVSGGIAMAEHMAKIIICGADGVGVDLALLVAMECRLCPDCESQAVCPVELDRVSEEAGAQRIINLLGSWHSQLIEVLGAMGLREVRRLRGEVGRAMFFEDLEQDNFAPIFGEKNGSHPDSPFSDEYAKKEPIKSWQFTGSSVPATYTKSRYRNQLAKYRVALTENCTHCGKCAETCTYDVFVARDRHPPSPFEHRCKGPDLCRAEGALCLDHCPETDALKIGVNPLWQTFGDHRWTSDMIAGTWKQAETGVPPYDTGFEYRTGASGGGFDKIDFLFPEKRPDPTLKPENIDLAIPLNRRTDDNRPKVTIGFPIYGGGMSYGSISLSTMVARARAYQAFSSFTCSGEGGYPDVLKPYDDHVITQVATGLFGVKEKTIQRVRIVEFKYAQGAKPGLGGHLLGDKVTPSVAKMRQAVEGSALFSPFPFHSVYSVEDHKKHVDWIRHINPLTLVSVKVSTPSDVDMVAVGSYYAGGHIIHIDGSYGGTGAAPDIAKKNIAMPIEYAIPKVHQFLTEEGVRDQMTLIASGGIRTAWDIAKAIALGADGVVIGTADLVALECIRCGNCESGRGCPRGIATTDDTLAETYDSAWGTQRLVNLFHSFAIQLQDVLWRFGMKSVRELVGRTDLLSHRDYSRNGA